jgi:hypothetical protein
MEAGWLMRVSTPPSFGKRKRTFRRKRLALARAVEGDHPSEVLHLPAGERVLRVRRQAGVVDVLDLLLPAEPGGDLHGAFPVPLHPHGQRLDPAEAEPGVERAQDAAGRFLEEPEAFGVPGIVRHNHAAQHVAVPVEVFCEATTIEPVLSGRCNGRREGVVSNGDERGAAPHVPPGR